MYVNLIKMYTLSYGLCTHLNSFLDCIFYFLIFPIVIKILLWVSGLGINETVLYIQNILPFLIKTEQNKENCKL